MIPVQSTSIAAVGYEPARKALYLRFHESRRTYRYAGVPHRVYRKLMAAESKGRFVNAVIKPNYPCTRIRGAG
jgi:hypothetical protein